MTLRHYREKLGLTPLQMAKRWKVSRITYSGWENGLHSPRGKLIDSILKIEGGRLTRAELLDTPYFRTQAQASGAPVLNGARSSAKTRIGHLPNPVPPSLEPPRKRSPKLDMNEVVEIGARSIFEFRAHPRRGLWQQLAPAKKEDFYDQMRQILARLEDEGFAPRVVNADNSK